MYWTYCQVISLPKEPFLSDKSTVGHGEAGAYLQQSTGERRGTPWTGRQSITGQHRNTKDKQPCSHSFTPKGNLEKPNNLTVFWTVGGSRSIWREMGTTCFLHAERPQPRTFLLQGNSATNCATMQPYDLII
ncbi:hypothetical protein CHARACLAT_023336 [Characodon lateralis]|uniref:Uncharacterized protein n=1 Tax=Characodon lateralis TaxID=208331 RepID=A0ABU7DTJ0_9TELE|nr:hypothetical protein [Characodon lateralis]